MTCIVGIEHEGGVTIGGDSLFGSSADYLLPAGPSKVFRVGEIIIGGAGSTLGLQALRYGLSVPSWVEGQDVEHWLVLSLRPAMIAALRSASAVKTDAGLDSHEGSYLIAVRGQLWECQSDLSFIRPGGGRYTAIGSGYSVAIGSLHSTQGQEPERRARMALDAAEAHTPFVRGPFTVETLTAP